MPAILDINWLYKKYYGDNPQLRRIVTKHSEQVAKKALEICRKKKLDLNPHEVYCAAMLHDIGVVNCNAPDIHALGKHPYLQHGIEGYKILTENGLNQFADICVRHTGAGISKEEIENKKLPLPPIDMTPQTLLEKLICYADKFFSKSHNLTKEKSLDEVLSQMEKFGPEALQRFLEMHKLFS